MTRLPLEQEFAGKTAFVLGGSSGIGLASAELFAERGANVVTVGHTDDAYEVARKISVKLIVSISDRPQSKARTICGTRTSRLLTSDNSAPPSRDEPLLS